MKDWARYEHAWRLRIEGCKLREVGEALGVSKERVRQMVHTWERINGLPISGRRRNLVNAARMRAYYAKRKGRELNA